MTAFAPTSVQSRAYFESRLGRSFPARKEVAGKCPFHKDRTASLSINLEQGTWFCHACNIGGGLLDFERNLTDKADAECWTAINATIGRDAPMASKSNSSKIVATYDYHDAAGKVVYQAVRYEPKSFRQRRPDGKGGWTWNMDGITRVPFNLVALVWANVALISEGEKDALNLQNAAANFPNEDGKLTYAATCNPGGARKWLDEHKYSPYLAGKKVFVFSDNDEPGRNHAQQVCASVSKHAQAVHLVELPGLAEHGDVSDYLKAHSSSELFALMQAAPVWTPVGAGTQAFTRPGDAGWVSEDMETFLAATDASIEWIEQDILAPGRLTQMFAPRGLGKSLLAAYWAVKAARRGLRVLILDRDNSRQTLQSRLRSFGAEGLTTLRAMSRETCPPLTKPEAWAEFPYGEFDLVIVDSLDSMAEGIGEQDSSKPAKAMAPLLDICHRENGPAVLLLGNTIKSAAHSRGSGVVEDRADIVFELRDGTDFKPTGGKPWIEELPAQGAAEWMARSARRKGRTTLRLAVVATKFRDGEEPAPQMLEINTLDIPWSVTDVTAEMDALGEAERIRVVEEKRAKQQAGVAMLKAEIERRAAAGQDPILKTEAEEFLTAAKFKRQDARNIIADRSFEAVPGAGKGHPLRLHISMKVEDTAEMHESSSPNENANSEQADSRRPHLEHTAEIDPSQTLMNKGDSQPPISAADVRIKNGLAPSAEMERASGQEQFFDLEV